MSARSGPSQSWPALLDALLRGQSLRSDQTAWAMNEIMSGESTPAQVAGFAVALRAKGANAEEMSGLAAAMLAHAMPIDIPVPAVDLVGTGGDGAHTVNISTMAAIVAAGAGATVVKHGNRAASSRCGAADLLEELGVAIGLAGPGVAQCVREVGIGFCFAPRFHPALRYAAAPRRELGIATAFNFLGPLTNPARPAARAIGCADLRMAEITARVTEMAGAYGMVFRGDDGLDELTTTTTSQVWVVSRDGIHPDVVDPRTFGLAPATASDLAGGDAPHNALVARRVLDGVPGPVRDAVLLNAAAAIAAFRGRAASSAGPLTEAMHDGLAAATSSIDSGAAAEKLARWVGVSAGLAAGPG